MAELKARSTRILSHLAGATGPATIAQLARQFHVSARTVRYDLDAIDDWLAEKGFPRLVKRPRVGVWADGDRVGIISSLGGMTPEHYILSPQERLRAVLLSIFDRSGPVSCAVLAAQLSVSRVTVARDLARAKKWLAGYDLHLEHSRQGYRVQGSEANLRRALLDLLFSGMETADILHTLDICRRPEARSTAVPSLRVNASLQPDFLSLFDGIDLGFIEQCVLAAQDDLDVQFADTAFAALVIHLAIAIQRLRIGHPIQMPEKQLASLKGSPYFRVAMDMADKLQKKFGVAIPEAEAGYISLHLQGTRVQMAEKTPAVEELARRVTRQAELILGVPLSGDEDLISGLALHLGPAIHRLVNGMPPVSNPLEAEIERDYPAVYMAAKQACKALQPAIGSDFPNSEIAYVAIHLGAAVERFSRSRGEKRRTPRVVVVCATGVGTANLLASRLRSEFPLLEISGVLSLRQAKSLLAKSSEPVISTVPVVSTSGPVLYVNPLLPPPDVARVSAFLADLRSPETVGGRDGEGQDGAAPGRAAGPRCAGNRDRPATATIVDDIMTLISRHARITEPDRLHAALSCYISRLQSGPVKGGKPMLTDLLTEETIELGVAAAGWEEAVRAAGRLLVKTGGVDESYVDGMVNTIKQMGPYVVVVPGVALAHARPKADVRNVCVSMVQLASPVVFGAGANDPVHLVFAFGAIDHDSHLTALSHLARILGNKSDLERLRKARSKDQVLTILHAGSQGGDSAGVSGRTVPAQD
ncbi:MAG: BglG family transcription antiterminator [Ignavibacteriales bacterium]